MFCRFMRSLRRFLPIDAGESGEPFHKRIHLPIDDLYLIGNMLVHAATVLEKLPLLLTKSA